jgi:hypothetical protein
MAQSSMGLISSLDSTIVVVMFNRGRTLKEMPLLPFMEIKSRRKRRPAIVVIL